MILKLRKPRDLSLYRVNVEKLFSRVAGKFKLGDTGNMNIVSSMELFFTIH